LQIRLIDGTFAMEKIFQQLLETNFAELTGLTARASIPVPEQLVNELLDIQLAGNRKITSCRVSIGEQNRMDIHVKTPLVPWVLNFRLKLFHVVDLMVSPKLRAFLEKNVLIGRIASSLNAFPEGISMYDDQITVDLGMLFEKPEQKELLKWVKSMEIRTEPGKLIVDVQIGK
jgi:hypothetical protein